MALASGTRFGPYEIVGSIGAGGMGEVYRSHDTTLERDVAIKVLPASFAEDAGRVERFNREAKTLAALNHPNIAQIYGLERSDGTTALVMELVEGPTLADRIAEGPLPADEALGIAMQIADALEAAHGQNIVHRDLKPENVKLRPDGLVKVLDFGIAKALAPENLTSGPASPIMTTPATQVGVILGTAAYMSPEQAKGKAVDQRTDIWAFGCVLYEMLTGQLAFGAEDVPTTLARVIANDANFDTLPSAVSPAVRQTIKLCLQKDVRKRVRDIGDVKLALEGAFEAERPHPTSTESTSRPIWSRTLPVAVSVALITAIVVGLTAWSLRPAQERPVTRFSIELEGAMPDAGGLALSSDGRRIVYAVNGALYSRRLDQDEATLIPGTDSGTDPFFSPDGASLAFFTSNELKTVGFADETPRVLAETETVAGSLGVWDAEGRIFFGQRGSYGLLEVPAVGGAPQPFADLDEYRDIDFPDVLPNGEWVLFSGNRAANDWSGSDIVAQNITTGERKLVLESGHFARYLSSGHLVFARRGTLYGVAFDADRVEVIGSPVPLVEGVATSEGSGVAQYAVASNGTLVYLKADNGAGGRTLVWVDRGGNEEPIGAAPPRAYTSPRISPDGTKLALNLREEGSDIWVWDFERESLSRLTFDPGQDRFPTWSLDGSRIAYTAQSNTAGALTTLVWRAADGTGAEEPLVESSGQIFPTAFLPDATGILVYGDVNRGNDDVALVTLDNDEVTPLLNTTFNEAMPEISPDGRWMAYASDQTGRSEIYVRPFPDINAGLWEVSTAGGEQPLWSPNGRELYYRNDNALMVVPIATEPRFMPGTPKILFQGSFAIPQGGRSYDISPDGQRFLMMREAAAASPELVVVENWLEELKRLVPTE